MRLTVTAFGGLRAVIGARTHTINAVEGTTVADVLAQLCGQFPEVQDAMPTIAVAVGDELVGRDHELVDGDEVGLLPPVSGG